MELFNQLFARKIVPVVVLEQASLASDLAGALIDGGLPVAEVTFRTDAAEQAISIMATHPEMIVGAGTVLTVEQVKRAVEAGARYIVSPGTSRAVVEYCLNNSIPILPGAVTASEIMTLLDYGIDTVKFFPAGANGGPGAIKALSAPFTSVRFVPTGGINAANINDYLSLPSVPAAGGSWMVNPQLIASADFSRIRDLTKTAVAQTGGKE